MIRWLMAFGVLGGIALYLQYRIAWDVQGPTRLEAFKRLIPPKVKP